MAAPASDLQKQILYGLLVVVGCVVWVNLFLLPQWKKASRLGGEFKQLREEVNRLHRDLKKYPTLEQERVRLAAQFETAAVSSSPEEQLPDLLGKIAQAAHAAHVRLLALKPKAEIRQLQPGLSGYLEVPLEISALSGYHQIGHFLDGLERSENPLRVQGLEIKSTQQDMWNHTTTITLRAYLVPRRGQEGS